MKILFIVGSFRAQSFNRQLALAAKKLIGDQADVSFLDYQDVPFFLQDEEFPTPDIIQNIRGQIKEADALWFFTPEYNGSYPGVLKNLIDYLSRPYAPNDYANGTALTSKKVTISGAGGKAATANARSKLKELLTFVGCDVIKPQTGVRVSQEGWISHQLTLDDHDLASLKAQIEALLS